MYRSLRPDEEEIVLRYLMSNIPHVEVAHIVWYIRTFSNTARANFFEKKYRFIRSVVQKARVINGFIVGGNLNSKNTLALLLCDILFHNFLHST